MTLTALLSVVGDADAVVAVTAAVVVVQNKASAVVPAAADDVDWGQRY